jgi:hypothetical protein
MTIVDRIWATAALTGLVLTGAAACSNGGGGSTSEGVVPARLAADYVHTVIEADRATYARRVVNRLQDEQGVIRASEHFEEDKALPLPAQMLRMGAERASEGGELRYSLISKWAINKSNLPRTDFERRGLDAVAEDPDQPYTDYQTLGGRSYFLALYADRAVAPACVNCHNAHEASPRKDFHEGDVMGGIVIAIPLSAAPAEGGR